MILFLLPVVALVCLAVLVGFGRETPAPVACQPRVRTDIDWTNFRKSLQAALASATNCHKTEFGQEVGRRATWTKGGVG